MEGAHGAAGEREGQGLMFGNGRNFRGAGNFGRDMRGQWVDMPGIGGTQKVWQNSPAEDAVKNEMIRQIKLDHPKDPAKWGVTQQQHDANVYNGYIQPAVANLEAAFKAGQRISIVVPETGVTLWSRPPDAPPAPAPVEPVVQTVLPAPVPAAPIVTTQAPDGSVIVSPSAEKKISPVLWIALAALVAGLGWMMSQPSTAEKAKR